MMKPLRISLAPEQLMQAINPWNFYANGMQIGLLNINLGQTPAPEIEEKVLNEVGSYGRQLGRIGDALEVLLDHVKLEGLDQGERDALAELRGQLAAVRRIKNRAGRPG